MAQQAARSAARRPRPGQGDGHPAGPTDEVKLQRTSMRQALAWNPTKRRLLLHGLKHTQDGNLE
eukprot:7570521-Pyramimonas_sp.AAC.1